MTGIIDVHSHALFDDYRTVLGGHAGDMPLPPWSVSGHLETMDRHGIAAAVLSMPNLDEFAVGASGRDLVRRLNDGLAAVVAQAPQRLGAFGSIPMDDVDAAVAETSRLLDELGFDGITLSPHHDGRYLGDAFYEPLLAELDRRRAVVFVHPGTPPGFDPRQPMHPSLLEFMFETTRMVTSLVLSGARSRHRDISFIATHGGGTLPYLAHRIGLAAQMPWAYRGAPAMSPQEVREGFASFHYDLTASTSPEQLATIRQLVDPGHLLLGFDQPMMPEATVDPAVASFDAWTGITDEERELVRSGNAVDLFPRFADVDR